jgi:DNA-binding response OmpR family regulator
MIFRKGGGSGGFREAEVILAFGDHRLDIRRRELRHGGEIVNLEPRAFDLLAYLVQHRDRVVSMFTIPKPDGVEVMMRERGERICASKLKY